jgi:hypothetical protein
MGRTVYLVVQVPAYLLLALVASLAALALFAVPQNWTLFVDVVLGGALSPEARVTLFLELLPFVGTSFSPVQGLVLVLAAVLAGLNIALATYHFREHRVSLRAGSGSIGGLVLGTLGAGCAACGTAVLAGLLSLVGAAGLLTVLPLEGLEIALLAVLFIALSIWWLADGMRGGEIAGCPVDPP